MHPFIKNSVAKDDIKTLDQLISMEYPYYNLDDTTSMTYETYDLEMYTEFHYFINLIVSK